MGWMSAGHGAAYSVRSGSERPTEETYWFSHSIGFENTVAWGMAVACYVSGPANRHP